jgi:hypothetical protein
MQKHGGCGPSIFCEGILRKRHNVLIDHRTQILQLPASEWGGQKIVLTVTCTWVALLRAT